MIQITRHPKLENNLGSRQKKLLDILQQKDYQTLQLIEWSFIYSSLQTFKCLGLVNYEGDIYHYEMLLNKLKKGLH